jgi:hypothetical protein
VERLAEFAQTHIAAGGTVLFTPVLRAPGEPVTLVCVHPRTDEEFKLPGLVAHAHADRPKRLEIHFVGINATVMNAFRAFIESGRPPSRDLTVSMSAAMTANLPQQPALPSPVIPEKTDFDLDVDVFDEDTLDTDDRVAHPPSIAAGTPSGVAAPGPPVAPDPGLKPRSYLLRCASCTTEPYAIDLGPCRGVLGLVADHQPLLSSSSGKVVSAPRLVSAEERSHRVQTFLQNGGQLSAMVDLMTLLGAVALVDAARDPADGEPLKSSRAVERLEAAAHKLEDGADAAHSKVKCHACKDGTLTIERVAL